MKIGVIGAGAVGSACLTALIMRNCAQEIVVLDKDAKRAQAVATDMQYGAPLSGAATIYAGDYSSLAHCHLIIITAGINEKTGGATDRNDAKGRLKLLATNAKIYAEIVPQIITTTPHALILVATDPPDPLADYARALAQHDRVLSTGTFLDSMRFRFYLGQHFHIHPLSIDAQVVGEHGVSQVFLWSSVRIGGEPLAALLEKSGQGLQDLQQKVENAVRYANITIIEGNNASQYGIGMVTARIAEIILRDENIVIPIGSYHPDYNATFSLPSVIGSTGVKQVLHPMMTTTEKQALQHSVDILKQACIK